jgi:hypothetical protein
VPGLRWEDLTHFALGIFWKAAVHSWSGSDTEPLIQLGPYEEKIRQFLLGGAYPKNIALIVQVIPAPVKHITFNFPCTQMGSMPKYHWFYIPGVRFTLVVGQQIPDDMRMMCLYFHQEHPILLQDVSKDIGGAIKKMTVKARKSLKFQEYISKREKLSGKKFVL